MFKKFVLFGLVLLTLITGVSFSACKKQNDTTPASGTAVPTEIPKQDYSNVAKVILLCGQSNMAGTTKVDSIPTDKTILYRKGFQDIQIMFSAGERVNERKYWNTSRDKLVTVKSGQGSHQTYFGPELGLAEYLTENYPGEEIYLVKHALGAAPITDYMGENEFGVNCFTETRQQFDNAVSAIKERTNKEIKVVAICWMQGETDAMYLDKATVYGKNLEKLAESFRTEYAEYAPAGGIAFIDAGISDAALWTYSSDINAVKKAFAATAYNNYFIDTIEAGLTLCDDNMHYDGESQIKLGRLFGEVIKNITG